MEIKINKERLQEVLVEYGMDESKAKDLCEFVGNKDTLELLDFEIPLDGEVMREAIAEVVSEEILEKEVV